MLINKEKKRTILNQISPSMKGFILTGIVFVASNLGFHSMIQNQFNEDFNQFNNAHSANQVQMRIDELNQAKKINADNILQLQKDIQTNNPHFFHSGENIVIPEIHLNNTSKASDFLACLLILHQKAPLIDWNNEEMVEMASRRFLPFSVQNDFIEHYKKFDPAYLQQVIEAQANFDEFTHEINFNLAQYISKDKQVFSKPNIAREELIKKFENNNHYIDTNQEKFLKSVQTLNTYRDKFLSLDHEYNRKFLFSLQMQMALLLASFAFSFLFWLNFPDNKDIKYFKRKSHYKISKKFFYCMSDPSKQVVRQCYRQIEKKANIPQNFISFQGIKYMFHSIKTNGLDIRLHYFKLKKEKLSLIDKMYLFIPIVAIAGLINYRELNIFDFIIFTCVVIIYICLSIQSTRMDDMKNYIQTHYNELIEQYPEFLLKLFMGDVDCKTVEYINLSKKTHCSIDLCSLLEEKQENYLAFLRSQLNQSKKHLNLKEKKIFNHH
jgi:hypothetical protein